MPKVVEEPQFRDKIKVLDDRFHAGELLSKKLQEYTNRKDTWIFAIPAGGVQVGVVVAFRLGLQLDLAVTRKLHVPWNKEAGFGAISWDGQVILNEPLVASLGLTDEEIDRVASAEKEVIKRRVKRFRGSKPFPMLKGETVIVVDDGLASGFSMLTTVRVMRQKKVGELVVAVPTAPVSSVDLLKPYVDKIVCLNIRTGRYFAVADAYRRWYDLNDEEVIQLLESH